MKDVASQQLVTQQLRLPKQGTYILIIFISKSIEVAIGKIGFRLFPPGLYAYTGSALGKGNSLPNRLKRHLKIKKKKHWHIDFLLENENVHVVTFITIPSKTKIECEINQLLKSHLDAKVLIPKFGASDCKHNCKSHLLFFQENP